MKKKRSSNLKQAKRLAVLAVVAMGSYNTFMQNSRLTAQLEDDKTVYASLSSDAAVMVASR
jgi:hypothetical protein